MYQAMTNHIMDHIDVTMDQAMKDLTIDHIDVTMTQAIIYHTNFTIPHLPGCFWPWTFFQNIWFNMVPLDLFMSHLATQLGYSAGEFQALQLIVLAAFGAMD